MHPGQPGSVGRVHPACLSGLWARLGQVHLVAVLPLPRAAESYAFGCLCHEYKECTCLGLGCTWRVSGAGFPGEARVGAVAAGSRQAVPGGLSLPAGIDTSQPLAGIRWSLHSSGWRADESPLPWTAMVVVAPGHRL